MAFCNFINHNMAAYGAPGRHVRRFGFRKNIINAERMRKRKVEVNSSIYTRIYSRTRRWAQWWEGEEGVSFY